MEEEAAREREDCVCATDGDLDGGVTAHDPSPCMEVIRQRRTG